MSQNKNIVLLMGTPNTGKTRSLKNLPQDKWAYLNCDLKETPFKSRFAANVEIVDPHEIWDIIDQIEAAPDIQGGVIDTLTFLMQTYERLYVNGAPNGQKAWGEYGNFYRSLIHKVKAGTKDYVFLSHAATTHDEVAMRMNTVVPLKGAVGRLGCEADFTTILSTKQMRVKDLAKHENDLLKITDRERADGIKFVFATRVTQDSIGEKMRSADDLWADNELYIDNDVDQVMRRIKEYYNS